MIIFKLATGDVILGLNGENAILRGLDFVVQDPSTSEEQRKTAIQLLQWLGKKVN